MQLDSDKLKSARQRQAITQEALAAKCEVSLKTIQRLERGEAVRADTAALVAGALGVAVADLATPAGGRGDETTANGTQLSLRRVRSGKHLFDQLLRTHVGRIECDVDATGETIGLLTSLLTRLQGMMSDSWGAPSPLAQDLPLLERLRLVAELNDGLRGLEAHGIGLFMGHYDRYALAAAEQGWDGSQEADAVVLTRLQLAATPRDRIQVALDREWASRPGRAPEVVSGSDILTREDERLVLLYPTPPLRPAEAGPGDVIEGDFAVMS